MIWWICGAVGYLVIGILVAAILMFVHDYGDNLYYGICALVWPLLLVIFVVYGLGSITHWIGRNIRNWIKYR